MNTDEQQRLAAVEQRLAQLEAAFQRAEQMVQAFAAGPGQKVLAMFGVKLP